MGFDLDSEQRRRLGYRLVDCVNEYFSSLSDRSVQLPLDQRSFADLNNKLPELGQDAAARLMGPSPAAATKPTSAALLWRSQHISRRLSKMECRPWSGGQCFIRPQRRTIRWTSLPACWGWDARRCAASRSPRTFSLMLI